jgi:hypothetical protein
MSAGPGQWPASEFPPWAAQEDVEMQVPLSPLLTVQLVLLGTGVADGL